MAIQSINLGSYANDGTGDDLRTAFQKVNNNFNYITSEGAVINGANLGNGTQIFAQKNETSLNLEFKTLTSSDNSITLTSNNNIVNLQSNTRLQNDSTPTLNNNLNLNGYYTYGGDIHNTVYGYDVNLAENFLSAMVATIQPSVDLGTIAAPRGSAHVPGGYTLDLNGTGVLNGFASAPKNDYDYGFISTSGVLKSNGYNLSLGSNLSTSGGFNITLRSTANANVTLPASGTLATTSNTLNQFALTTSAQLGSVIADSTGTGKLVFHTNTTLDGQVTVSGSVKFGDNTVQSTAWPATSGTKAANAAGVAGQISWDANYIYVCVADNTWKRAQLVGGY